MFGLGATSQLGIGIAISLHNNFSKQATQVNNQLLQLRKNANSALTGAAQDYRAKMGNITMAAGAMTYGMFQMAKEGAKFDDQIRQTLIVGGKGFGNTKKQLVDMALGMSKSLIATPQQIAETMTENARQGVRTQMGEITKYQLMAATATNEGIEATSKALLGASHSYQIPYEQFGMLTDAMVAGANASSASIESLGHSLEYTGFTAKRMNIPFKDLLTMLSVAGQKQVLGSSAGTGINNFLIHLAKSVDIFQTPKQKKAWAALGVNSNVIRDMVNQGKTMDAMMVMSEASKGMDPTRRISIFNQLFNNRGDRGLAAVIEGIWKNGEFAANEFKRIHGEVYGSEGLTKRQNDQRMQSPWAKLQLFYQSLDRFKIVFFQSVLPVFTSMVKVGTHVIDFLARLANTPLGKVFMSIISIVVPLIGVMAAFRFAILTATFALRGLSVNSAAGGFGGMVRGLLGGVGTSTLVGAGKVSPSILSAINSGAYKFNTAGSLYNAANGRIVMGAANAAIYRGAGSAGAGMIGRIGMGLGTWLPRIAGAAFRWLPYIGIAYSIFELLKWKFGKDETEKQSDTDGIETMFFKHLDMLGMGQSAGLDYYERYNTAKTLSMQKLEKQPLNQTINLNVNGQMMNSQTLSTLMNQNMNTDLNFETPFE